MSLMEHAPFLLRIFTRNAKTYSVVFCNIQYFWVVSNDLWKVGQSLAAF